VEVFPNFFFPPTIKTFNLNLKFTHPVQMRP